MRWPCLRFLGAGVGIGATGDFSGAFLLVFIAFCEGKLASSACLDLEDTEGQHLLQIAADLKQAPIARTVHYDSRQQNP